MKELTRVVNDHLGAEVQDSHSYLTLSIWLREKDLAGSATFSLEKATRSKAMPRG